MHVQLENRATIFVTVRFSCASFSAGGRLDIEVCKVSQTFKKNVCCLLGFCFKVYLSETNLFVNLILWYGASGLIKSSWNCVTLWLANWTISCQRWNVFFRQRQAFLLVEYYKKLPFVSCNIGGTYMVVIICKNNILFLTNCRKNCWNVIAVKNARKEIRKSDIYCGMLSFGSDSFPYI